MFYTLAIPIYGSRIGLSARASAWCSARFSAGDLRHPGASACDIAAADRVASPHGIPRDGGGGIPSFSVGWSARPS